MKYAAIGPISVHFPERIETNAELGADNPRWDMDLIASKTGIHERRIAADNECSSDLGVAAAKKLFEEFQIDPASIDFLFFCTQTPDYPLPTTACLIQDRLGLPTSCGALDFNLGCSGYIYGLSLCEGLIRAGVASRILFVTGETYSKLIDPGDRSLRTIFGDAGTATLVESSDVPSLEHFRFGTNGQGANTLLATTRGFRCADDAIQPRHRKRWKSDLYMDGPELINFTMGAIPGFIEEILAAGSLSKDQIDYFLFHQATYKMLSQLQQAIGADESQVPVLMKHFGNTVSSTIPILINQMRKLDLTPDLQTMLIGFGVGWSWSGCLWKDVAQPAQA